MKINNWILAFLLLAAPFSAQSQNKNTPPKNWHHLDLAKDGYFGVSANKAYEQLLKNKTAVPVVVAVIDGGVDIHHEDLKANLWINIADSLQNGVDNDNNGYINDKYGWNFIGGAKGENVQYDNLEVTRLVSDLEAKYISVLPTTSLKEKERREFELFQRLMTEYANKLSSAQQGQFSYNMLKRVTDSFVKKIGKDQPTLADFKKLKPDSELEKRALKLIKSELKDQDFKDFYEEINEAVEHYTNQVNYHLNKDYNSRHIVGDNYEDSSERFYGNSDVKGPDADHGTHVAGIIGAVRDNNLGIQGIANHVRIMAVRTVPDGDERDKDVANSIRYAVDNGAKVINMSFGKAFTKDKYVVDEAIKYAMEHDVLIVHAAGNDGKNTDINSNFPNRYYIDSLGVNQGSAEAYITVGASKWKNDKNLVAPFSNYGKRTVDVFAPGVNIYSTMPENEYKDQQGTSMAAPVVAGIAALIRSYYPSLSAVQVKEILMNSVTPVKKRVKIRDERGQSRRVKLKDISVSGGIVNAFNALELAEQYVKEAK